MTASPSEKELVASEITAHSVLHKARACLGGAIQILRDPSEGITVRGIVESSIEREELAEVLGSIPHLRLSIDALEEHTAQASSQGTVSTPKSEAAKPIQLRRTRFVLEDRLRSYFASRKSVDIPGDVTRLSNEAVSLSRSSLKHAWALRRLNELVERTNLSQLKPASRDLLGQMIQAHTDLLEVDVNRLQDILRLPLAPAGGRKTTEEKSYLGEDVRQRRNSSLTVAGTIEDVDTLIQGLFAGADLDMDTGLAVEELLRTLQRAHSDLYKLKEQLAQSFTGESSAVRFNSDSPTGDIVENRRER